MTADPPAGTVDEAAARPASPGEAVYAAVEVLYAARHRLDPDVLRSLAGIYVCASAARYHEPYEAFWEDADWAAHDTAECEADGQAGLGHEAVPLRGSVRDQGGPIGEPVTSDHMLLDARYPLAGQCGQCHQPVQRTGPDAAWEHAGPQEGQ